MPSNPSSPIWADVLSTFIDLNQRRLLAGVLPDPINQTKQRALLWLPDREEGNLMPFVELAGA
jgi:hypothetical protein